MQIFPVLLFDFGPRIIMSDYNLARTASAPETVTSLPGSD